MGRRDKVFDGATGNVAVNSNYAECIEYEVKVILIKNNHATNSFDYRVYAIADIRDETDSTHILKDSQTLAAGDTIIHKTTDPWDVIYVSLVNTTLDQDSSGVVWINCGGYNRS